MIINYIYKLKLKWVSLPQRQPQLQLPRLQTIKLSQLIQPQLQIQLSLSHLLHLFNLLHQLQQVPHTQLLQLATGSPHWSDTSGCISSITFTLVSSPGGGFQSVLFYSETGLTSTCSSFQTVLASDNTFNLTQSSWILEFIIFFHLKGKE